MSLVKKTENYIRRHGLLEGGERVLVAVSGGADSVALLHVLCALRKRYHLQLSVLHVQHGLRGRAAEDDAGFVKALARRLRIDFRQENVNVKALAKRRKVSLEMAAREARYTFFRKTAGLLAKRSGSVIVLATAHTSDDQAETLLLKLTRGAGSAGLSAISRRRRIKDVMTIRPFLETGRESVMDYLRQQRIDWREDASNSEDTFLRNRVRHEVLPLLRERLNPNVRGALTRTADILREESEWMDALAEAMFRQASEDDGALQVSVLNLYPLAARRRIIRCWLQQAQLADEASDFRRIDEIERVLLGRRGSARVQVGPAHDAVRRYGTLSILERKANAVAATPFRSRIALSGETLLDQPGLRVCASQGKDILRPRPAGAGRLPARASLSRDVIGRRAVHVRSWRPGDRMKPLGLSGSVKLQDLFVNAKLPQGERSEVPLFECGNEIIWIPGYRVARGWEVQDATSRILELSVERI